MGLDLFASRNPDEIELTKEDLEAFEQAEIDLCGGMYSNGGPDGSFRGKVYQILLGEITGIYPHYDWIPPEKVKRMYEKLLAFDPSRMEEEDMGMSNHPQDVIELRKFFKVCSERGLGMLGW